MSFLNPILLSALALASVPVIIHLLNRRRFRLVEWAPMKYLKLTIKTNRRRMRLEQLILLALRTLVVVLLVLAVARPVISSGGLAGWLGAKGRTSRLLVIDDSLSTGYLTDGRSAFDAAKEVADELLKSVGAQDAVTAVVTSAPDAPLAREAQMADRSGVLGAVAQLRPADTRNDWPATFKAIDDHLAAATFPSKEVVIITDLRKGGWDAGVTEVANRWDKQGVKVRVVDVGSRVTHNASVPAFEMEDAVALPGGPVSLKAVVRNDLPTPMNAAQALLTVGGQARPVTLPDLEPGKSAEVPLSVSFASAGAQPVQVQIPADALPADDVRWIGLNVRANLNLTLVDGEPGARPFEGEVDFLHLAFTIGNVPWQVKAQPEAEWSLTRPAATDVLVLANVPNTSQEQVAFLEQLVASGTGLMVFCGDAMDVAAWNERLFRNGAGLLPARLDGVTDGDEPVTGLVLERAEDSPLDALGRIAPAALARVSAKKHMIATVPSTATENVRVLARWNDAEGRPAVIEKRFGRGRVLLWTVTADRAWSDWPIDPTYVLAARSAATAVARPDPGDATVTAGQPIRYPLPEGATAVEPKITPPGATEAEPTAVVAQDNAPPVLHYPRTARAGVYTLKWKDATGKDQSHVVCVNPDRAESDLTPIADDELTALMGSLDVPIVHYTGPGMSLTGQGREVWRTLAIALLALAAVETVLAVWVGRER